MRSKYLPAVRSLYQEIVFLEPNDRNEYAAAIRSTPQNLLRPLIQRLAVVAPGVIHGLSITPA